MEKLYQKSKQVTAACSKKFEKSAKAVKPTGDNRAIFLWLCKLYDIASINNIVHFKTSL